MNIHILVLDGIFDTGLSTLLDTLVSRMISQAPSMRFQYALTWLCPALEAKASETLELLLKRQGVGDAGYLLREMGGPAPL